MKISVFFLMIFCATAAFSPATTTTITFNVPLQLTALHQNISEVRASCCCYDQAGLPIVLTGHSPSLVPDANGNINQTVTVSVQALAGKDIANAKTYACSLELKAAGSTIFTSPSVAAAAPIELRVKSGTTFVAQVNGSITW